LFRPTWMFGDGNLHGGKKMKQFIAFGTVCILWISVCFAQGGAEPVPISSSTSFEISVPESLGRIAQSFSIPKNSQDKIVFEASDNPLVVLVADAHTNISVQEKISQAMEYFSQNYGLKHVYVEGTDQEIDMKLFRSFPYPEVLKKVSKRWLNSHRLSGAEYKALNSEQDFRLIGIEDKQVYLENTRAAIWTLKNRPVFLKKIQVMANDLSDLLEKYYSKKMKRFDEEFSDIKKGIPPSDAFLREYLSYEDQVRLSDPDNLPFNSWQELMDAIKPKLVQTREEELLSEFSEVLQMLRRLISLELTKQDWSSMAKHLKCVQGKSLTAYPYEQDVVNFAVTIKRFISELKEPLEFYRLAENRDEVLFENLQKSLETTPLVWMVLGGFHMDGMIEQLKRNGIPYVVFIPAGDSSRKVDSMKRYRDLMGQEYKFPPFTALQLFLSLGNDQRRSQLTKELMDEAPKSNPKILSWLFGNGYATSGRSLGNEYRLLLFREKIQLSQAVSSGASSLGKPVSSDVLQRFKEAKSFVDYQPYHFDISRKIEGLRFSMEKMSEAEIRNQLGEFVSNLPNETAKREFLVKLLFLYQELFDQDKISEFYWLASWGEFEKTSKDLEEVYYFMKELKERMAKPISVARLSREINLFAKNELKGAESFVKREFLEQILKLYLEVDDVKKRSKLIDSLKFMTKKQRLYYLLFFMDHFDVRMRLAAITLFEAVFNEEGRASFQGIYHLPQTLHEMSMPNDWLSITSPLFLNTNHLVRKQLWRLLFQSKLPKEALAATFREEAKRYPKNNKNWKQFMAMGQAVEFQQKLFSKTVTDSERLQAAVELGFLTRRFPILLDMQNSLVAFQRQKLFWGQLSLNNENDLIHVVAGLADPDPMIRDIALQILVKQQVDSVEFEILLDRAIQFYQPDKNSNYKASVKLLKNLKIELLKKSGVISEALWDTVLAQLSSQTIDEQVLLKNVMRWSEVTRILDDMKDEEQFKEIAFGKQLELLGTVLASSTASPLLKVAIIENLVEFVLDTPINFDTPGSVISFKQDVITFLENLIQELNLSSSSDIVQYVLLTKIESVLFLFEYTNSSNVSNLLTQIHEEKQQLNKAKNILMGKNPMELLLEYLSKPNVSERGVVGEAVGIEPNDQVVEELLSVLSVASPLTSSFLGPNIDSIDTLKIRKEALIRLSQSGPEAASRVYFLAAAASLGGAVREEGASLSLSERQSILFDRNTQFQDAWQLVEDERKALQAEPPLVYLPGDEEYLAQIHQDYFEHFGSVILPMADLPQDVGKFLSLLKRLQGKVRLIVIKDANEPGIKQKYSDRFQISALQQAELLQVLDDTDRVVEQEGVFLEEAQKILMQELNENTLALVSKSFYVQQSLVNLSRVVMYVGEKMDVLSPRELEELILLTSYLSGKEDSDVPTSILERLSNFGFYQKANRFFVDLNTFTQILRSDQQLQASA